MLTQVDKPTVFVSDQFIQITTGNGYLYALDGWGHVWRFAEITNGKGKWVFMPDTREEL